jgi:hypothetical protein
MVSMDAFKSTFGNVPSLNNSAHGNLIKVSTPTHRYLFRVEKTNGADSMELLWKGEA